MTEQEGQIVDGNNSTKEFEFQCRKCGSIHRAYLSITVMVVCPKCGADDDQYMTNNPMNMIDRAEIQA